MKFSLRVESCGKCSTKIFGQEILWERKRKNKSRKRTKREIIGKIRNLSTIGWRLFKRWILSCGSNVIILD